MSTNMLKKYFHIIMLIALVSASRITAQETPYPAGTGKDSEEQRRLLELVEKYTDLATKTRMNADFVPGMISVLYGDDLETRGIRTVGEAMTLVPGMNISLSSRGVWKTVVRGIPKPFASGHVKILLNGAPLTTASGVDPVPDMPIGQVERIEIIRGPGSAIHGEFACAGVMNIITRKKDTRIFGTVESNDTRSGGIMVSREFPENDFLLSLSAAGTKTRYEETGAGIPPIMAMPPMLSVSPDNPAADYGTEDSAVAGGPLPDRGLEETGAVSEKFMDQGPEWAAGSAEQKKDYGSGLLILNYKDFFFRGHWLESHQGNFSSTDAPADDEQSVYRTRLWGGNLGQGMNLFPGLHADFSIWWQKQEFETDDEEFYPPEYISESGGSDQPYGIRYRETLVYGGVELTWKGWERHTIFTECSFAKTALESRWLRTRLVSDNVTDGFIETTPAEQESPESRDRWLTSLTLQDEFEANDRLTLFGGLRYDHYDDAGDHVSPRIAAVYRLNRRRSATHRHILKAQYARAFRPPTFLESQTYSEGNPGTAESETVDTYELAYIYRRFGTAARIMLFYSDIDARIADSRFQSEPTQFRSRGAELELEVPLIANRLKLDLNLSYTDAEDQDLGEKISDASDWLANAGLTYRMTDKLAFGLQYRYAGNSRDADEYHTADVTITVSDLGIRGLTLRAGVKNISEANLSRSVSEDSVLNTGNLGNSGSERWWWLKISYNF